MEIDQIKTALLAARDWLLETEDPGPRHLALRDLYQADFGEEERKRARQQAHNSEPIARALAHMNPEGWWVKPGPGYGPKYKSTVWSLTLLGQLGASVQADERVNTACQYLLSQAYAQGGFFSYSGRPAGTFDCLQGNLTWALSALGCRDERLEAAYDWMARSQTGEGVAPMGDKTTPRRYYANKRGPDFVCSANDSQPCAWGAVKVMLAFSLLPPERRGGVIGRAIERGAKFFLDVDPLTAAWPYQGKVSGNWWKFGFPVFYITDLLQLAEALVPLGYGADPRLAGLINLILSKQTQPGKWALEYRYADKTWGNYGKLGQVSKWVSLRALRVLKGLCAA